MADVGWIFIMLNGVFLEAIYCDLGWLTLFVNVDARKARYLKKFGNLLFFK